MLAVPVSFGGHLNMSGEVELGLWASNMSEIGLEYGLLHNFGSDLSGSCRVD